MNAKRNSLNIQKSNDLIERGHNLTKAEFNVMHLAVLKFQNRGLINNNLPVEITVDDYINVDSSISLQNAYSRIKEGLDGLHKKTIVQAIINPQTQALEYHQEPWLMKTVSIPSASKVNVLFNPIIIKGILRLDGNITAFTSINLLQTCKMGPYAQRLYELLLQYSYGKRKILYKSSVIKNGQVEKSLRFLFDIKDHEYLRLTDFKRRVLDPAIKEINEKSDIFVGYADKNGNKVEGYKNIKDGKEVVAFEFCWSRKVVKEAIEHAPDSETDSSKKDVAQPDTENPESKIRKTLIELDVSEKTIQEFISKYGVDYVAEKTEILLSRIAKHKAGMGPITTTPGGFLRTALEKDFKDSERCKKDQDKKKEQQAEEKKEKEQTEKNTEATKEKNKNEGARIKFDSLSEDDKQDAFKLFTEDLDNLEVKAVLPEFLKSKLEKVRVQIVFLKWFAMKLEVKNG